MKNNDYLKNIETALQVFTTKEQRHAGIIACNTLFKRMIRDYKAHILTADELLTVSKQLGNWKKQIINNH